MKPNMSCWARRSFIMVVSLAAVLYAYLPVQAQQADPMFTAVEKDGTKMWEGGGTVDLKSGKPVTLKVKNTLDAEHGFAIDSMKVKEVIKPGEEKTITVPLENIDKTVTEHKVYCQLHPKHGPATLKTTGN
jgi:heme/copper-type cytochrome/quinol oxidase subunit 2